GAGWGHRGGGGGGRVAGGGGGRAGGGVRGPRWGGRGGGPPAPAGEGRLTLTRRPFARDAAAVSCPGMPRRPQIVCRKVPCQPYALLRWLSLPLPSIPRPPRTRASRSASTCSRSAMDLRSRSMSQWLRGGLTFFGVGRSAAEVKATAPQTRHSHVAGTSASAANGTLK